MILIHCIFMQKDSSSAYVTGIFFQLKTVWWSQERPTLGREWGVISCCQTHAGTQLSRQNLPWAREISQRLTTVEGSYGWSWGGTRPSQGRWPCTSYWVEQEILVLTWQTCPCATFQPKLVTVACLKSHFARLRVRLAPVRWVNTCSRICMCSPHNCV